MVDWLAFWFSAVFGFFGGLVWWIAPPAPTKGTDVFKRIAAGAMVGILWHVTKGVNPFDSTGNWNPAGVLEILGAGFAGLAVLGVLLPDQFDKGSIKGNAKVLGEKIDEIRKELGTKAPPAMDALEELEKMIDHPEMIDKPSKNGQSPNP